MIHVTVIVRNPAEPERIREGLFLVDTGAVDSVVPRKPPHDDITALAEASNAKRGDYGHYVY